MSESDFNLAVRLTKAEEELDRLRRLVGEQPRPTVIERFASNIPMTQETYWSGDLAVIVRAGFEAVRDYPPTPERITMSWEAWIDAVLSEGRGDD